MANTKAVGVAYADPAFDSVQVGTSGAPIALTSAGILNGSYATTSSTTGDNRLSYERMTWTSTGSGETVRAYAAIAGTNGATAGTINAAHFSVGVDGGTVSGAANAIRATVGGTTTNPGGTLAALQLDSNFASGGTWSNATFLRVTNSGTGTIGTFASFPAAAVDGVFRAKVGSPAVTHTIPVVSNGTTYYIMVSTIA